MEKRKKKAIPNEKPSSNRPVNPWDAMWGIQSDEENVNETGEAHGAEEELEDIEELEEKEDDKKRDPWLW